MAHAVAKTKWPISHPSVKNVKIFISTLKSPTYRDFMIKKSLKSNRSKSHAWAPLTSFGLPPSPLQHLFSIAALFSLAFYVVFPPFFPFSSVFSFSFLKFLLSLSCCSFFLLSCSSCFSLVILSSLLFFLQIILLSQVRSCLSSFCCFFFLSSCSSYSSVVIPSSYSAFLPFILLLILHSS